MQKDEFMINVNNVGIKEIKLSNKTPYSDTGANRYYAGYLKNGYRPLSIIIKDTELCANNMHILTNCTNFLKYVEIWNKIVSLFNKHI